MSTRVSSGPSIARGNFRTRVSLTFGFWHRRQLPVSALNKRWRARDQITPSEESDAPSSSEARSSGESAHAESYGKTDTEDVYDDADKHHLQGKRTLGSGRERQDNAIHEEIDGHTIKNS